MPRKLMEDPQVFPERREPGLILVEAKDKESLLTIDEIRFVKVDEVDRIIYNSKSGRTRLEWKRLRGDKGKVVGDASLNSLVNLSTTKVLGT